MAEKINHNSNIVNIPTQSHTNVVIVIVIALRLMGVMLRLLLTVRLSATQLILYIVIAL